MSTTPKPRYCLATAWIASGAIVCLGLVAHRLDAEPLQPETATTGAKSEVRAKSAAPSKSDAGANVAPAATVDEARGRAELLHEALHAALQVVHHEYYREDEGLTIPALTLKKVFRELATRKNVQLRWLVVDAAAMNTDHLPQNDFERRAVAALAAGKDSFERVDDGVYLHAARITLGSECLKCHLPNRKSTEDRAAGLVIGIPLAK